MSETVEPEEGTPEHLALQYERRTAELFRHVQALGVDGIILGQFSTDERVHALIQTLEALGVIDRWAFHELFHKGLQERLEETIEASKKTHLHLP